MSKNFHPLRIAEIRRESEDAVSLRFDVPAHEAELFRFTQGQYLTLRSTIDGQEVRRSYSICAGVNDGELRVAIKTVAGGVFSTFANRDLQVGQTIDVMPPDGRFFVPLNPEHRKHYVAVVAGSGITPVLSIIKTTLETEPNSRFTLLYGNQKRSTILFADALLKLKSHYMGRLAIYHFLSRETQDLALFNGRLDAERLAHVFDALVPVAQIDDAFICGPNEMIDCAEAALETAGLEKAHIHTERFGIPVTNSDNHPVQADVPSHANLTVIMDGAERTVALPAGENILDAAIASGIDLPYSCKGGVCCTCRAKVLTGKVRMNKNFALEPAEVEKGFVLTCQAHALTENVVVSFDER